MMVGQTVREAIAESSSIAIRSLGKISRSLLHLLNPVSMPFLSRKKNQPVQYESLVANGNPQRLPCSKCSPESLAISQDVRQAIYSATGDG